MTMADLYEEKPLKPAEVLRLKAAAHQFLELDKRLGRFQGIIDFYFENLQKARVHRRLFTNIEYELLNTNPCSQRYKFADSIREYFKARIDIQKEKLSKLILYGASQEIQ
ncbi:MAG TPA: hypothetical protein VJ142_02320 [Candidatus Nanoarchaeia archaeon]|nr:hypothetical protein [Candidatus Nanoarchaeia archaeon]